MNNPGRFCPAHYGYAPGDFARAVDFVADTLIVVGGLYGNLAALDAAQALLPPASHPSRHPLAGRRLSGQCRLPRPGRGGPQHLVQVQRTSSEV